jgi:hypothetical protein
MRVLCPIAGKSLLSILAFCLSLSVHPANASETEEQPLSVSLETWAYSNWQTTLRESLLNPENRLAKLPGNEQIIEARLDTRLTTDAADFVLRTRALQQRRENESDTHLFGDAYVSQGFARVNLNQQFKAIAGRELLTWGPANFRSPSNPFYFDAGRTQPLLELSGIDLARIHYMDSLGGVTAGYVFDAGHLTGQPDFRDTVFFKYDYRGSDYLVSGIMSKQKNHAVFLGSFGQWNLDDAILLYGELGSGQRPTRLDTNSSSTAQPFVIQQPSPRELTTLLGASYTLLNGQVLSLEYLHDGHGYSSAQEQQYFQRVSEANLQLQSASGVTQANALATIGTALSKAPALLSRDYLSLMWQSNPQESNLYWRLMAASNVKDHSCQSSLYVEKNISPRISFFALFTLNAGSRESEYGALLRHSGTIGIKLFVI